MFKVIDFVKSEQLTVSPIKYNNKEDKDCYKPIYINKTTKWHQLNHKKSISIYDEEQYNSFNGMLINLKGTKNTFICFDADDEKANNFMLNFISENNLKNVSTPSLRNITNGLSYKNHYYFKLEDSPEDVEFGKKIKNHPVYGDLDILFLIAEHKNSTIDYNNISTLSIDLLQSIDEEKKEEENQEEVDEEEIVELLKLLNDTRGNNYNEWFQIGSSIKSRDDTLFDLFDKFSSKRTNYKGKSDVKKFWKSFKGGNYGLLCNMAKEDNLEKYKKWRAKWYKKEEKKDSDDEYLKLKEQFKDRLFIIENPLQYGYINEEGETNWYQLRDLKQILKPFKVGKKDFIDLWLEDADRKTYSKIDFQPKNNNQRVYNLFKGFKYDNDEEHDYSIIQPFFDLIGDLLNKEQVSIDSFLDWWAWIRQRPEQKTEKAIVLYSDVQGVGKNTLIQLFRKIISYSNSVNDANDLVKNFNSHITSKLVICADEVKVKNTEIRDDLKNMITRTEMLVERKGVDAYEISDYSNYIFTTNNQSAFYIEPTDRRFILLQTADKVMTQETSKRLYSLINDEKLLKAMDSFLKNRNIPEKLEAPMNDYKKLLIAQSLPAYIQMIYRQPHNFAEHQYRINDLYECAIDYAKRHGLAWTFTADKMAKDFKTEFSKFSRKTKECNKYCFPTEHELKMFLNQKRPELVLDELDTI